MSDLSPEVEQQLASLSEGDWAALTAKVRAPDTAEQLRTHAAKVLSGPQLDAFVNAANPAAFTDGAGGVDEEKVMGHLTALFAVGGQEPPGRQWGQTSGNPVGERPGDQGRRALERRHGVKNDATHPGADGQVAPGARGRAAVARRHGRGQK